MKNGVIAVVITTCVWTISGCSAGPSVGAPEPTGAVLPSGVGVTSSDIVETSPSGFSSYQWSGERGSDGPIYTGDLNGDGLTDVFMWRDSTKDWSVNLSTGSGFTAYRWQGDWATDADTPSNVHVCDLNADGLDDVFMFRASSNDWSVNLSTGTNFNAQRWGGAWGTDGPQFVGNFDGDTQPNGKHRCDIMMARTWAGDFTVNISTGTNFIGYVWAAGNPSTDGPVHVGDLNADGKTDAFMFRASTNDWSVNLSTGSDFTAQRWGGNWGTDGPIFVGDLDGDGDDDVFMWRAATNWWSVNLSTGTNFVGAAWEGGCGSDGPAIVGDFDGNGKKDIMMWRDGFKQWVVNLSTGTGFNRQIWNGDWGSDGPILTGHLDPANTWGNTTDVFMWRDPAQVWSINLSNLYVGAPGPNATTPGCGTPPWDAVGPYSTSPYFNQLPIAGKIDDIQISTNYDGAGNPAMYVTTGGGKVNGGNFSGGGGGVWRSRDFNSISPTWTPLIDHIPGLTDSQRVEILNAVSVGIDPTTPQTMYVGVNGSSIELLKSTDGGNTWTIVGPAQVGSQINRVIVDPNGTVYVAASNGLFVTEDGGASFTNVAAIPLPTLNFTDVSWNYYGQSFNVFAAGIGPNGTQTGIYTVAKVAGTWTFTQNTISQLLNLKQQSFALSAVGQIRLGNAPVTPTAGVVATFRGGSSSILQLFRVTQNQNGTFTWSPQFFPTGAPGEDQAYGTLNQIDVVGAGTSPDGRAYFGATGIAQSDGAGGAVNIQDSISPYTLGPKCGNNPPATCAPHTDTHAIMYSYVDGKMYFGTDGGLFRFLPIQNAPGATWESVNSSTLRNMLSYSVSASPTQPNVLVVGHQDNGIIQNNSGTWSAVNSSPYNNEGDQLFFDPNDSSGSTVFAWDGSGSSFQKSTDSGVNFSGLTLATPSGPFFLTFHPTQFNRFMVVAGNGNGGCTVLETTNGMASAANLSPPIGSCPTAIGYIGNDYYVATSSNGTTSLFQGVPNGGVPTWTSVWPNGNPQASIVAIVGDAANSNSIYLATNNGAAGRVFFKPDITDGTGWTLGAGLHEITGTGGSALQFPVSKLAAIATYGRTPTLYAATTAGIFQAASLNGASTVWSHLGSGFADVAVTDLRTDPVHHGVDAATFGRGAWTTTDWSAATDIVGNGLFETGNLSGWTVTGSAGAASIVSSPHSGYYAAQAGLVTPTNGDSTIFQVISVPPGATTIAFSYMVHCPDTVTFDWATASFVDNITKVSTTILGKTCTINGSWVTVSAPVGASAGHSITLTLTSHDDNNGADPTYTWFDDVTVF